MIAKLAYQTLDFFKLSPVFKTLYTYVCSAHDCKTSLSKTNRTTRRYYTHLFPVARLTIDPGSSSPSCIIKAATILYPANLHPSGASRVRANRWFQTRAANLSPSVEALVLYCSAPLILESSARACWAAASLDVFLDLPAPCSNCWSPTLKAE